MGSPHEPIGVDGAAALDAVHVTAAPSETPIALLADLVALTLHAQLEEPSDETAAAMVMLIPADTLTWLFALLREHVQPAIDRALAEWQDKAIDAVSAGDDPLRAGESP